MVFIHYGSDKFNPKRKYHELPVYLNKPSGFWGCPMNAKLTWEDFIKYDWTSERRRLKKKILFKISNAKILDLSSKEQLKKYRKVDPSLNLYFDPQFKRFVLDWDKIKKDYDGVIIYISKLSSDDIWKYTLSTFDVDSICIWNLSKVKQILNKEKGILK